MNRALLFFKLIVTLNYHYIPFQNNQNKIEKDLKFDFQKLWSFNFLDFRNIVLILDFLSTKAAFISHYVFIFFYTFYLLLCFHFFQLIIVKFNKYPFLYKCTYRVVSVNPIQNTNTKNSGQRAEILNINALDSFLGKSNFLNLILY